MIQQRWPGCKTSSPTTSKISLANFEKSKQHSKNLKTQQSVFNTKRHCWRNCKKLWKISIKQKVASTCNASSPLNTIVCRSASDWRTPNADGYFGEWSRESQVESGRGCGDMCAEQPFRSASPSHSASHSNNRSHVFYPQAFFEEGILPRVLSIAQSTHNICRLKGWMAVSCLVRNFEPAYRAFLEADGFECLLSSLDLDDVRLQRRCLFLLEYLLSQQLEQHLADLQQEKEFQKLIRFMSSEDVDVRENALKVLCVMVKSSRGRTFLQKHSAFRQSLHREGVVLENLTDDEKECRSSEVQWHGHLKEAVLEDRV